MANEFDDQFDPNEISEELLGLAGLYKRLHNLKNGQQFVLHLITGERVAGNKTFFDEQLGIVGMQCQFNLPIQSTIETSKTEFTTEYMHWEYPITKILGIGTFPKVAK